MLQSSLHPNAWPGTPREGYFALDDYCRCDSPHFCERLYDMASIGFVVSGAFDYKTQTGNVTAVPGSVVFGNVDEYFGVRHMDTLGNRRLVACFNRRFLEEIAEAYGLDQPRFHLAALPPGKTASSLFAKLRSFARGHADEEASSLAASALGIGDEASNSRTVSPLERRRILAVVEYIEQGFSESCSIADLAEISGFSRYHFMRLFKAVTGQSVNQYVITTRLRAAMSALTETKTPVSEIAFDVGFNDISHFNASFRTMFGCTPRAMRKQAA